MPFVWLNYNTMILWHNYTTLNSFTVGVLNIIPYFCVYITVSSNFFWLFELCLCISSTIVIFVSLCLSMTFLDMLYNVFILLVCVFLDCHFFPLCLCVSSSIVIFSRYAYVCLPQLSFFSLCLCISSSIVLVFAMLVFLPLCAYVCLPTL